MKAFPPPSQAFIIHSPTKRYQAIFPIKSNLDPPLSAFMHFPRVIKN